jgi:NACHT domain
LVSEILKHIQDCLPRVPDTSYDPLKCCLPGTRSSLLISIRDWLASATNIDAQSVFWITAEAGVGKSTLAHTIAVQATQNGQLGACFFLDRSYTDKQNPRLIINTLAFRLASFNLQIAYSIYAALEKDLDLGYSTAVSHQFYKLIVEPIIAVKDLASPIVIVIDDLDAINATDQRHLSAREGFLTAIAYGSQQLLGKAKILITSRPERDILETLSLGTSIYLHSLGVQTQETQRDIEMVAHHLMNQVSSRYLRLGKTWPGAQQIKLLVKRAKGLFIWITIAGTFIKQRDPEKRLALVLADSPRAYAEAPLDELYKNALIGHVESQGGSDMEFYNSFRQIMGLIASLKNPLSPSALDSFLSHEVHSEDMIDSLQSFLTVTHVVEPLHPSFVDFLTDKARCKDKRLFIDLSIHKRELAKQCLRSMHSLSRDICHIGDFSKVNTDIQDLEHRVRTYIPEHWQYACSFWAQHLIQVFPDSELYGLLQTFCYKHLLHWIELSSLLKVLHKAFWSLELVKEWCKVWYLKLNVKYEINSYVS